MFHRVCVALVLLASIALSASSADFVLPSQPVTTTQSYAVEGTISSDAANGGSVTGAGNLSLTASNSIHFSVTQGHDFHVEVGAKLSASIGPVPPAAPTNLTATQQGSHIHLTWSDNSNIETGFVVQRDGTNILSVGANTNSADDYGASVAGTYQYRVTANNNALTSTPSLVNYAPGDGSVPFLTLSTTAPTVSNSYAVNLAWNTDPSAVLYNVIRRTISSGDSTVLGSIENDNSGLLTFQDTPLQGVVVGYEIEAISAANDAVLSEELTFEAIPYDGLDTSIITQPTPYNIPTTSPIELRAAAAWGQHIEGIYLSGTMSGGQPWNFPPVSSIVGTNEISIVSPSEGLQRIDLVLSDAAGNLRATWWSVTVDFTPPVVIISSSKATPDLYGHIGFTFFDAGGGLQVFQDGLLLQSYSGNSNIETLDFYAGVGTHTVTFADLAGNFASQQWTFEVVNPAIAPVLSITPAILNDASGKSGPHLSWSASTGSPHYLVKRQYASQAGWSILGDVISNAFVVNDQDPDEVASYYVTRIDGDNKSVDSNQLSFGYTHYSAADIKKIMLPLDSVSINGSVSGTLNVESEWGSSITACFIDGIAQDISGVTFAPPLTLSLPLNSTLANGAHSAAIFVTDQSGNARAADWRYNPPQVNPVAPTSGGFTNQAVLSYALSNGPLNVYLNGRLVASPSDTSATAQNPLQVAIGSWPDQTSVPDGNYQVTFANEFGTTWQGTWNVTVDRMAPVISNLSPASGRNSVSNQPIFSATISDLNGSGVDWSSLKLSNADTNDVIQATIDWTGTTQSATVTITPITALADGINNLRLSIDDLAANIGATSFSVKVITNPDFSSVPAAPEIGYLQKTDSTATVMWTYYDYTHPSPAGFAIFRSSYTLGDDFREIGVVDSQTTWFTDGNVDVNQSYSYYVIAFNSAGDSPASQWANVSWSKPPVPYNLTATSSTGHKLILSWDGYDSVFTSGFTIWRKSGTESDFSLIGTVDESLYPFFPLMTFNDEVPDASKQYTYRVQAYNDVHVSEFSNEATYSPATSGALPEISIVPADGTTLYVHAGTVTIVDSGCGIDPADVTITLHDDTAGADLVFAQPEYIYNAGSTTSTFAINFQTMIPGDVYTLNVIAVDQNQISNSSAATFIYAGTPPAAPVVDNLTSNANYITLFGHVSLTPNISLKQLIINVPGNSLVSSIFDVGTGKFQINLKSPVTPAPSSLSYQLQSEDVNDVFSSTLAGTASFRPNQPGDPVPPLGGGLSGPVAGGSPSDPPTGAGTHPGNSAATENRSALCVSWDFSALDISGVTNPRQQYSYDDIPNSGKFRGWIPCIKTTTCKILGIVRGGEPPYTIKIDSHDSPQGETHVIGTSNFTFDFTPIEGLNTKIRVLVTDKNGLASGSFTRNLYKDTTAPMNVAAADNWKMSGGNDAFFYGYNLNPYNLLALFNGVSHEDFFTHFTQNKTNSISDELIAAGSGIARFDSEIQGNKTSVIPRDVAPNQFTTYGEYNRLLSFDMPNNTAIPLTRYYYGDDPDDPDGTYSFNPLTWPMTTTVIDGAGNSTSLAGVFAPTLNWNNFANLPNTPFVLWCVADSTPDSVFDQNNDGYGLTWHSVSAELVSSTPGEDWNPMTASMKGSPSCGTHQPFWTWNWHGNSENIFNSSLTETFLPAAANTQTGFSVSLPDRDSVKIVSFGTTGVYKMNMDGTMVTPPSDDPYNENPVQGPYTITKTFNQRVLRPHLLIDENNDDSTDDEDFERQLALGVSVPIDDSITTGTKPDYLSPGQGGTNLRMVTFDKSLALPAPHNFDLTDYDVQYDSSTNEDGTIESATETHKWNGSLGGVVLTYSSNIRLWKTRAMGKDDLLGSPDPDITRRVSKYRRYWNFEKREDYNDFVSLQGKFYIECLPDSEAPARGAVSPESTWIGWQPVLTDDFDGLTQHAGHFLSGAGDVRLVIHAISDRNEGFRKGGSRVPVTNNVSVELSSGALKGAWPLVRVGSPIIPDIYAYYDSRDMIGNQVSPRLIQSDEIYWDANKQDSAVTIWPSSAIQSHTLFVGANSRDVNPPSYTEPEPITYKFVDSSTTEFRLGALRRHFRHTLEMRLIRSATMMYLVEGDGRRVSFAAEEAITPTTNELSINWLPEARKGDFSKIKAITRHVFDNHDSKYAHDRYYYVLTRPNENRQYLFEHDTGKLIEIRDTYDNVATLEYEEYAGTRGCLKRVSDNLGNVVQFDFGTANGFVSGDMTVTGPSGQTVSIGSGGVNGYLGSFPFKLNPSGRIVSFENGRGGKFSVNPDDSTFANEAVDMPVPYKESKPKVVSKTYGVVNSILRNDDGNKMSFSFDFAGKTANVTEFNQDHIYQYTYDTDYGIWKTIQPPNHGIPLRQEADGSGQITLRSNHLNGESNFTYSDDGLPSSISDPDGITTQMSFTQVANPHYTAGTGPNFLEYATFPLNTTDGKGDTVTYSYDLATDSSVTNVVEVDRNSDSLCGTTKITRNQAGFTTKVEGPKAGLVKTSKYDEAGRIIWSAISGENLTEDNNKTLYVTDVFGQANVIQTPDKRLIKNTFDVFGHVIVSQGPMLTQAEANVSDGGTVSKYYDNFGVCLSTRDAEGRSTSQIINSVGAVTNVTSITGAETTFSDFDGDLNPATSTVQATDNVTVTLTHKYDDFGREKTLTVPGSFGDRVYTTTYDDDSKVVTYHGLPGQGDTTVSLKSSGRVDYINEPEGQFTQNSYDGNGMLSSQLESGQAAYITDYDRNGIVTKSGYDSLNLATQRNLDELGIATKITSPGSIVATRSVDVLGRVSNLTVNGMSLKTYNFGTDARYYFTPQTVIDDTNQSLTNIDGLDAFNRPTQWTTMVSSPVSLSGIPPLQQVQTSIARDQSGMTKQITDPNGKPVVYNYNNPGKMLSGVTDQAGIGSSVLRHRSGAIKTSTDDRGMSSTYIYDSQSGELKATRYADSKGVSFEYDGAANVITETYATAIDDAGSPGGSTFVVAKTYDPAGRVKTVESPKDSGNITTIIYTEGSSDYTVSDADGNIVSTQFDKAGRVQDVNGPGARHTHYDYEDDKIAKITRTGGYVEEFHYDNILGRLASRTVTGQGTTIYHYDDAGDLESETDSESNVVLHKYDSLHRCVQTTLPGGRTSAVGYDPAGFAVRGQDANGQQFLYGNRDNGQRTSVALGTDPLTARVLQTYSYAGSTATSDGSVSWTLDAVGRVQGSSAGEIFEYNDPLGRITRHKYGTANTVDLNYSYHGAFLNQLTDGNDKVTFSRKTGGRLESETYSNGIVKSYGYDGNQELNSITYKNGASTLFGANFVNEVPGRRKSLVLTPSGETFSYLYDGQNRLASESRNLLGVKTTTSYSWSVAGKLQTRTTNGAAETYTYQNGYELQRLSGHGTVYNFTYDNNGNTLTKSFMATGTLSITYKNTGTAPLTYTLGHALPADATLDRKIIFPPTPADGEFATIQLPNMNVDGTWMLKAMPGDSVSGSGTMSIDKVTWTGTSTGEQKVYEAENLPTTQYSANVVVSTDPKASLPGQGVLSNFGGAAGDWIQFATNLTVSEQLKYTWNELNRLTIAQRLVDSNLIDDVQFTRNGGWQATSATVNGVGRSFTYGCSGELLEENGRSYVNAGVDRVMWSKETTGTKYWLNDANGSVYGIANSAGTLLESQHLDALGNTKIYDASGQQKFASQIDNRTGFQGRTAYPEVGLQEFRNRMYDPQVGRFLSRDPLGSVDGPNVYGFCGGDPVNNSDPMGTKWVWNAAKNDYDWVNDASDAKYGNLLIRLWSNVMDVEVPKPTGPPASFSQNSGMNQFSAQGGGTGAGVIQGSGVVIGGAADALKRQSRTNLIVHGAAVAPLWIAMGSQIVGPTLTFINQGATQAEYQFYRAQQLASNGMNVVTRWSIRRIGATATAAIYSWMEARLGFSPASAGGYSNAANTDRRPTTEEQLEEYRRRQELLTTESQIAESRAYSWGSSRLPARNGSWNGEPGNSGWESTKPVVTDVTGGEAIPFEKGRIDLSKWSISRVKITITGDNDIDRTAADGELAKWWNVKPSDVKWFRKNYDFIWHHDTDMQLVPGDVNRVPHIGTASEARTQKNE